VTSEAGSEYLMVLRNCCKETGLEEVELDNPPDELLKLAIRRAV